jgi:hypothetical protein
MTEMLSDPYPPEGVRLKLDRAREHLVALDKEIRAFSELKPYRITLHQEDADGLEYVLRGYLTHWPPEMLPLIIGDCLQNMRTALEHLAWELVLVGGGSPNTRTAFPIFIDDPFTPDAKKWLRDRFESSTQGMPSGIIARIKGLQPYNAVDPVLDPLWVLNEYARIDRHQKLSVIFAMSDHTSVSVGRRTESGDFVSAPDIVADSTLTVGAFVHGAPLFRFTLRNPEPNVQVKYYSPLRITFGSTYTSLGEPAVDVLGGIHRHIQQRVLPQFAEFFSVIA